MEKNGITQELRFTFDENGKIVKIEPIYPEELKKPENKKYTVNNLTTKMDIDSGMERMAVVFYSKKNPTCTKWRPYETEFGWVEICVEWV